MSATCFDSGSQHFVSLSFSLAASSEDVSELSSEFVFPEVEEVVDESLTLEESLADFVASANSVGSAEGEDTSGVDGQGVAGGVGTSVGPLPFDGWKGAQ